jgi:hypothetical protein
VSIILSGSRHQELRNQAEDHCQGNFSLCSGLQGKERSPVVTGSLVTARPVDCRAFAQIAQGKILTRLGFTSIDLESIIKISEAYQGSFDAILCNLGETDIRLIDIPCTQSIVVDGVGGLSELEKKKLLDRTSGLDRIILLLLFETGLQIDDLIGAKVSDLNIKEGTLLIRASGEEKQISPGLLAELMNYLRMRPGQVYLLEGRCGKPITVKWKRCVLDKMLK